jgi:RHS repeat-associated protein
MFHMDHRDYSPTLGRWLQVDPVGFAAQDVNLYRALGDEPIGGHSEPD